MPVTIRLPEYVRPPRDLLNGLADDAETRQASVAAEGAVIPLAYGPNRLGGKPFAVAGLGDNLVVGAWFCLGAIDGFDEITINDAPVPVGVTVTTYTGTTTQGIDPTLAAAIAGYGDDLVYGEDGQQIGIAYLVAEIPPGEIDGYPRIQARLRGRKVYDPRDVGQSEGDPATWLYSTNPSLALADFAASNLYGAGLTVDWASAETAADANDALIGGEKRREIGLSLTTLAPVEQWIEGLRVYAGCFVIREGDSVKLVPDRPAAVARSLTAADVIQGSLRPRKRGLADAPTVVRVIWTDTSATPWRDRPSDEARAAGVDTGATPRREQVIRLPGIQRHSQAYREAVERLNVYQLTDLDCDWDSFDEALQDQAGDVIDLTHPVGLTAKPLRLTGAQMLRPGRWRLRAAEYDAAVYSDAVESEPSSPDTNLPSPLPVAPVTGLALIEENYTIGGTGVARVRASWSVPAYAWALDYQVQAVDSGGKVVSDLVTTDSEALTAPLEKGVLHTVRVRTRSSIGAGLSVWTSTKVLVSATGVSPADVTGFGVQILGASAQLMWDAVADRDLSHYHIKHTSATGGAFWGAATTLVEQVAAPATTVSVPALVGTYLIKAVDLASIESANAALIVSTITRVEGRNVIASVFESPTFGGSHQDTYALDGVLQLAAADVLSDWNKLSLVSRLSYGKQAGFAPMGVYGFDGSLDLGAVYTSRLTAWLVAHGENILNVMSGWDPLSDVDRLSGGDPNQWDVVFQVRTTDDDPAAAPSWGGWRDFVVGDYTARAFEWRVILYSSAKAVTPNLIALAVNVDMPDRIDRDEDVNCPAGGLSVTFSPAFMAIPAIAISAQGLTTGDYYQITNKAVDGFDIIFKASGGSGVARTFDWIAKGYGYAA